MGGPWFPRRSPDEYRDPGVDPALPGQAHRIGLPRQGHGTIYVSENRDGSWSGSWQDDYPEPRADGAIAGIEDIDEVTEQEIVEWAAARPAAEGYVVLTAETVIDGVRQCEAIPLDTWLRQRGVG